MSQVRGCCGAYVLSLGSVCKEVQDPSPEGGVESQISELNNKLGGHKGIEC